MRNVKQHAKLPGRKRPNGKALTRLIRAVVAHLEYDGEKPLGTLQDSLLRTELQTAVAPFVRYADSEGSEIR